MSIEVMTKVWAHGPAKAPDLLMLLSIADYSDETGLAWPSMRTLAAKCRVTPDTARATVRRLEADGWLSTEVGGRSASGRGIPNRYQISLSRLQGVSPVDGGTGTPVDPGGRTPVDGGAAPLPTGEEPSVEPPREPSGEPPLTPDPTLLPFLVAVPATGEDPIASEFAGFWRVYPRKVDRQDALAAYRRARRSASVADISAGLRDQLPDLEARPRDKIPHAATWLNRRRWESSPEDVAQPSGKAWVNPFGPTAAGQ